MPSSGNAPTEEKKKKMKKKENRRKRISSGKKNPSAAIFYLTGNYVIACQIKPSGGMHTRARIKSYSPTSMTGQDVLPSRYFRVMVSPGL